MEQRGPGQIHVLYPNQATSSNPHIRLDYYEANSLAEVRYMGVAPDGVADDEDLWVIRRFSHAFLNDENKVTDVQVKENVAWDDRESLGWT